MRFARFNWRPKLLVPGFAAYELLVILLTFGAPIVAGWRVTRPGAGHGRIVASLENVTLHFSVSSTNQAGWAGAYDLRLVALWLLLPPLAVWLLWLSRRPRGAVQLAEATLRPAVDPAGGALREIRFGDTVVPLEARRSTTPDGAA